MSDKRLLCKIGIHKYQQSRPLTPYDVMPFFGFVYNCPERKCKKCGKEQKWLPGYGGSELGCWINKSEVSND